MKVLVAGKGFIGTQIAEKLDGEVKFLSKNSGDYKVDITEDFEIDEEFGVLIHTVGLEPGKYSEEAYRNVHVDGTRNLVEGINANRTVYISALGAGKIDHPYMKTKKEAEEIVRENSASTILRPSLVYGEDNKTLKEISEKFPVLLFPRLNMKMQPIHVDDFIDVIVEAANGYEGETLELGGPEKLYVHEIFRRYYRSKDLRFYSFPVPSFLPKTAVKILGRLPVEKPEFSGENANLIADNVIEVENDAKKVLGHLRKIE